ncbi:uncharacterized protein F5147DRAFT_659546 [Suillus discolor]|uniref:Crinkler effector protein N-terminal domain-containing protein n=1 Tax=Suillus discolor TaxID=1912936 RepID=A0A9P7JL85_9AGAM|nr:uncharacterized protein F5147DRAFT_659546 [Suillus discolor]KAG2085336.1 hypothetical protein F5147DRAFT_659546 [Suillus discolor]
MSNVFMLYCWIRGTEINQHFGLKILHFDTVHALKTELKASQDLDVPASALRLYKPRVPVAELEYHSLRTTSERVLIPLMQLTGSMNPPLRVKNVIDEEDPIKMARKSFLANMDDYSKRQNHIQSRKDHNHLPMPRIRQLVHGDIHDTNIMVKKDDRTNEGPAMIMIYHTKKPNDILLHPCKQILTIMVSSLHNRSAEECNHG